VFDAITIYGNIRDVSTPNVVYAMIFLMISLRCS
jgi:NADH:ubiquinone oxidoreductase subunit 6 (subunit J)